MGVMLACPLLALPLLASCAAARHVYSLDGDWNLQLQGGDNQSGPIKVPGSWEGQGFGTETVQMRHQVLTGDNARGARGVVGVYSKLLKFPAEPCPAGHKAVFMVDQGIHRHAFFQVGSQRLGEHVGYLTPFEAELSAAIAAANERSPLTIAVANAGVGGAAPFLATEVGEWERVLRTNLTGAFLTLKLAGQHLAANGGGAMCAVSSIAGSKTHRFMTSYNTSKAGLEMLVRSAADELGSLGIRVNAVAPGLVETDISGTLRGDQEVAEDYRINMPLGRHGTVADTGAAIRFLCGPESSWITGVVLPVDGGHHLRRGPNIDRLLSPFFPDLPPISPEGDR